MTSQTTTKIAGAMAAVILILHSFAYVLWTEDDVGVTLRYVANLVEGRGLVYNAGERVEAISNLGLALLLAPVYALLPEDGHKVSLLVVAKCIGLGAALLGLREVHRLARTVGLSVGAAASVPLLVAGSTPFAAWSIGGLEVPLVAWLSLVLITASAELLADGRYRSIERRSALRRAGFAAAMLVLLRVDGFVLPVIVIIGLVLLDRASVGVAARIAAPAVIMALACTIFRLGYYGHFLPTPVAAKVDLAASLGRAAETLTVYVLPYTRLLGGWLVVATAVVFGLVGRGELRPRRQLVALSILGLFAYTFVIGKDWMPLFRFLVATVAPLMVLLVSLAVPLVRRVRPSIPIAAATIIALVAAQALAGHAAFRARRSTPLWYLHPTSDPSALVEFWQPAVDWLHDHLPADATLLTSEAGFIPYLSGLRTIDSYGLATPAIAQLPLDAVVRSTLGVHTAFVSGHPTNAAERFVAEVDADACVLQERMVKTWNDGQVPDELFDGRWQQIAESPVGVWSIYRPAGGS